MELVSEAADLASSLMSERRGPVGDARARSCSGDTFTPALASSLERGDVHLMIVAGNYC